MKRDGWIPSGIMVLMSTRRIRKGEELLVRYDVFESENTENRDDGWCLGGGMAKRRKTTAI